MDSQTTEPPDGQETATPRSSFRAAWRHRRWRWLLGSVVVSLAGDFLYWIALVTFLVSGDGGAEWIAAALIVRQVPYVLFGPLGGAIADRLDRRRLLITLDLSRAIVFTLLTVVIATDAPRIVAIALVGLSAVAGTIYRPTIVALTPQLVTEDDLGAANAAEASLSQLSWFVGPALGALLVTVLDAAWVIGLDASTFVVSAIMIAKIGNIPQTRTDDPTDTVEGWFAQSTAGFAQLTADRGIMSLAAVCIVVLFCFGAEQVLYVLVAADRLGLGPEGVGVLMAAMGVGGLIVAPLTPRIGGSPQLGRWFLAASGIGCGALAAMSVVETTPVAVALAAAEGAALIIFEIGLVTLLQRAIVERSMGRVSGSLDAVGAFGQMTGSVAAPLLATGLGLGWALAATGLVGVVVVIGATPWLVVLSQRLERQRCALRSTTEWLGRVDGLAAFEPVDRERLARSAVPIAAAEGDVVLREGDAPDHLYAVRTGVLAVDSATSNGRPIPDLGPGDLFGEIGLLRQVPRTATVTARTDCELLRIDGKVFADVASAGRSIGGPLDRAMRDRLARTHPHGSYVSLDETAS